MAAPVMDMAAALRDFEQASADFQVPSRRQEAEKVLMSYRSLPSFLSLGRYILDHSNDAMVQFHAASTLSEVVVRESSQYSVEEVSGLRDYLVLFMAQRAALLRPFVRDQLLLSVALIVKMQWATMGPAAVEVVHKQAAELLADSDIPRKSLALAVLHSVISQFSTHKATAIGLTFEVHYRCRKSFESAELGRTFMMVMQQLRDHAQMGPAAMATPELRELLLMTVRVAETILYWDFTSINASNMSNYFQSPDADAQTQPANVLFAPPAEWRDVLLSPGMLQVFFTVRFFFALNFLLTPDQLHQLSMSHGDRLGHSIRQSLIQLAGLHGSGQAAIQFCHVFFQQLHVVLSHVSTASDVGNEVLAVCQMLRRLLCNYSLELLSSVPGIVDVFEMTLQVTLQCLRGMAQSDEDRWFEDAFTETLHIWTHCVSDVVEFRGNSRRRTVTPETLALHEAIVERSQRMFEAYLMLRLSSETVNHDEEIEEDRDLFEEQLTSVAALGRASPSHAISLLLHMLRVITEEMSAEISRPSLPPARLELLHERTHWLFIVLGHLLADSGEGELPMVPSSVMQLSVQFEGRPQEDPVLIVIEGMFRLVDLVAVPANSPALANMSPLVIESSLWLLDRWCRSYLFFNQQDHPRPSVNLSGTYGSAGTSTAMVVNFVLDKIIYHLTTWTSNGPTVAVVNQLLGTLGTRRREMRRAVIASGTNFCSSLCFFISNLAAVDRWPTLFEQAWRVVHAVPSEQQADLVVKLCNISFHSEAPRSYYDATFYQVMQRLDDAFSKAQTTAAEEPYLAAHVAHALELLRGVSMSSNQDSSADVFNLAAPRFPAIVGLLRIFQGQHEVTTGVLSFFSTYAEHQVSFISNANCNAVYGAVLELLKAYSQYNLGKLSSADSRAEEEAHSDLTMLLALLKNLMSRDFLDFSQDGPGEVLLHREETTDVSQIIFCGLGLVVPLVTRQLLKIPELSEVYFGLINVLFEVYPEKVVLLPEDLFASLSRTIEFGIEQYAEPAR